MSAVQPIIERRSSPVRTCDVCLDGVYVKRFETDAYAGPDVPRRVGFPSEKKEVRWHVESCSSCGHVQIFRRDLVRSRT